MTVTEVELPALAATPPGTVGGVPSPDAEPAARTRLSMSKLAPAAGEDSITSTVSESPLFMVV